MTTNKLKSSLTPVLLLILLLISGCRSGNTDKLLIAASSNMQFALEEIVEAFKQKTNIDCELIFSSSGILTAQIIEGAPFNIFVSADMKYPETIFERGKANNKPEVYARGKLVLWTLRETITPSLEILVTDSIKHIAIANQKTAPYGKAAIEVLMNAGIYNEIEKKLVFGESIAQTNQFIISRSADIGFTAVSVVKSQQQKDHGEWVVVNESLHTPIEQGIVILEKGTNIDEKAQLFYDFIFSDTSSEILKSFGYHIVTK